MTDPLLTLLFPMETMVPQPPSAVVQYTITLDLPTSIIFSCTIIIFFFFLFHVLNGFLQWFLDVRPSNHDPELGGSTPVAFYQAIAQNNMWVLGILQRLVSSFEERRLHRLRVLEKLPPLVDFGSQQIMNCSSNECAICLEEFLNGESCQIFPACNHLFHSNCIDVWLRKNLTCPICRNCILDT